MLFEKIKGLLFLLLFIMVGECCFAQNRILDSMRYYLRQEPNLFASFNNRNSIVNGRDVRLLGIKGGLDFGKVKIYSAYSWMGVPASSQLIRNAHTQLADTQIKKQSMSFLSFGYEYTWYQSSKWRFSAPVHLGLGVAQQTFQNTENVVLRKASKLILPLEIGVSGSYYFTDWLTANAGFGNRFVAFNFSDSQLSGPYYKLGIGILIGVIYKKIRNQTNSNS